MRDLCVGEQDKLANMPTVFTAYSGDSALSVGLLAAHLYYRALLIVPSLIRSWLSECRDRQLLNRVSTYTATHFSPAIIRTELTEVKDPDAAAELADENLTIKVANAVNEVTASYAVDEYKLGLTVKLPSDYPLHGIEIRDNKPVGVPEDRWRAWMLGIQQIISYRVRPLSFPVGGTHVAGRVGASRTD